MSCWIRLGIEPTKDQTLIRDAYRARLPEHHPESDPQGFQALREAYESATRFARFEEPEIEDEGAGAPEIPQTVVDFYALLEDPARRFNLQAWQVFRLQPALSRSSFKLSQNSSQGDENDVGRSSSAV
jgi:DnaJ domain.